MNRESQGTAEQDVIEVLVNTSPGGHDNNAEFVIAGEECLSANGGLRGKNNPIFPSYNTGTGISDNTTYLVLWKATNLGGSTGTVDLKNWILSADQFDTFKAGGLTETELDAALAGTGASDVYQRGVLTYTPGGAYHRLTSADVLMMQLGYGLDGLFDELRISNSSSGGAGGGLDEVTPLLIPEPGRVMLAGLGLILVSLRRNRRRQ